MGSGEGSRSLVLSTMCAVLSVFFSFLCGSFFNFTAAHDGSRITLGPKEEAIGLWTHQGFT